MANTTLNPGDTANITLSGGNLIGTATGVNVNGLSRAIDGKTTGKWYFEVGLDSGTPNYVTGAGIGTASATAPGLFNGVLGIDGAVLARYGNGTQEGVDGVNKFQNALAPTPTLICIAVDLDNHLFWARPTATWSWNNSASNDPATGVGGYDISGLVGALYPLIGVYTTGVIPVWTCNFGDSAFSGAVPAGFTAGWAANVPSTPTGLAVASTTSSSIGLTWNASTGTAPITYTLQYRLTSGGAWTQVTGITLLSDTVTGLTAGTSYDFEVQGVNSYGSSAFSAIVSGSTAAAGVPSIPTGLASVAVTTTTIEMGWNASTGPGPITYTLQYRVTGTATWTQVTGITGTTDTATGLTPGTYYDFQVEAANGVGPSGFSTTAVVQATPLPQPVPPTPPIGGGWRAQVGLNWRGMALVGDRFSGVIGKTDFASFTEFGQPMYGLVTSPPLQEDRARIFIRRFELDVESGVGLASGQGEDPMWMLDWSKDGGRTWSELQLWRSAGRIGEYTKRLRWMKLGQARQWVLRLQCSDPVRRVIIGTYLDLERGQP